MQCEICPKNCRVDRDKNPGACGVLNTMRVGHAQLHGWEEPCISGKNGSGAIFFSGCPLKCVYCQNWELSHNCYGTNMTHKAILKMMDFLVLQGAHNINLVTPTHFAPQIAEILREFKSPVPIVYNTSGYEKVETLKLLEGLVDIYLTDFKYSDNAIAKKYSGVSDYFEVTSLAVLEMQRQVGVLTLNDEKIAQRGMIVRHLILPSNVRQSVGVLRWIADNLPPETMVSLMSQYIPNNHTGEYPAIDRKLSRREYKTAVKAAIEFGLQNLYAQSLFSANEQYVPDFKYDLSDKPWVADEAQCDYEI